MSRHQAPDELLLDYAAGALPDGPALAVAIHLALDPASRSAVDRLQAVGGALLDGEHGGEHGGERGADFDESALERIMSRLDGMPVEPAAAPLAPPPPGFEWAPPVLVPFLGAAPRWRKVIGGFENVPVHVPGDTHRVELLRLMPGRSLPQHRHAGSEYTIVLQGGFTDRTGNYGVGDFAVGPGATDHEPIADPGEPCIALIVLERPIVLTGPIGRWFNPLVKRGWL